MKLKKEIGVILLAFITLYSNMALSADDVLTYVADRLMIQELINGYAKGRDTTNPEYYRRVFAEDAQLRFPDGQILSDGIDEIIATVIGNQPRFNADAKPDKTSYGIMRHVVTNINIDAVNNNATGDYYVLTLAFNEFDQKPDIISVARNEEEYIKRKGRWYILSSTLFYNWEYDAMGKALQIGPYTPPQYKK